MTISTTKDHKQAQRITVMAGMIKDHSQACQAQTIMTNTIRNLNIIAMVELRRGLSFVGDAGALAMGA
jgi:hypothetical protein